MFAAIGLAGLLLSFGPALPGYSVLYRFVPFFQGVRGAARFGYLLLVAVAALSGFGLAHLRARWVGRPWLTATCVGLVVLVNLEALRAPITYRPFEGIPRIYQSLAAEPRTVIAEFPFFPPEGIFRNAEYMLNSTSHWRPLLNGYSGFAPVSYVDHYRALRDFPDAVSIAALRTSGVTHTVVHLTMYEPAASREMMSNLQMAEGLTLIADENGIRIYRLAPQS